MEKKIFDIIKTVLENEELAVDEEMDLVNDLGMDSLILMDAVIEIENLTNNTIMAEEVIGLRTVKDMINLATRLLGK